MSKELASVSHPRLGRIIVYASGEVILTRGMTMPEEARAVLEAANPACIVVIAEWERAGYAVAQVYSDTGGATWTAAPVYRRTGRCVPRARDEGGSHPHHHLAAAEAMDRARRACGKRVVDETGTYDCESASAAASVAAVLR